MQENLQHSVQLDDRKRINVSGVESVIAFSEVRILLLLHSKEKLQITGADLKISGFSKTSGTFSAEGVVTSFAYNGKSFVSKLFK